MMTEKEKGQKCSMDENILECRGLCLGYNGRKVLDDLNFTVKKGDFLSVVGENGAGKSTLVKALLGLIKPTDGEIIYGQGMSHSEIGYLPQQSEAQRDFPASVFEVVLSGCLGKKGFYPFYNKNDKKTAHKYMELLDVDKYSGRCYRELSGGQQQRVLLARTLCAAGSLILLDEPVTGLDPVAGGEFYSLIQKLNEEGITVIMVSHDIPAAVKYSCKILHIKKDGMFFGGVEDYVNSAAYKKIMGEDA